ncbi:MAG: ATP-binding protein [Bacteroidota bacterium]
MLRFLPLVLAGLLSVPCALSQGARGTPVEVEHDGFLAKRWTTEDGLPVNHITGLHAAQGGYLWLTTFDGLVRFDGHRFTVFNTANSPGLPSNRLVGLHEAPDGHLWVLTETGALVRFDGRQFTAFPDAGIVTTETLYQDGDTLWVPTERGLFRYDPAAGLHRAHADAVDELVSDVLRDHTGALWVYGAEALYRFAPGADVAQRFTAVDGVPPVSDLETPGALFDAGSPERGEALWLGTPDGLRRWDGTRFATMYADAPYWDDSIVAHIQADPAGTVWFGTTRFGWLTEGAPGQLRPLASAPRVSPRFQNLSMTVAPDGAVWRTQQGWLYRDTTPVLRLDQPGYLFYRAATFDAEGHLWIAEDGLYRVRPRIVQAISTDEGLPTNSVYPLLQTRNGGFWIGTWTVRGLTRWQGGDVTRVGLTDQDARAQDLVSALHEDPDGTLWVGTLGRMGALVDGRFRVLEAPVDLPFLSRVSALHTDRAGGLWAGSESGVTRLQVRRAGARYVADQAQTFASDHAVRVITETQSGDLLVGTFGRGLGRYLGREDSAALDTAALDTAALDTAALDTAFEWLTTADGLASDHIRDLHEDDQGILWIVTQDRGLCRLDRHDGLSLRGGDLACFDTSDGLFDDSLHRLLEDDQGRLWLSSNRGIFWLARADLDAYRRGERSRIPVVSYTERDGMGSREANGGRQPAGVKAADGTLWFPTQGGVVVIDPRTVAAPEPAPVVIEQVAAGGERLALTDEPLSLAGGTRDLDVTYTSLAFTRPETVRYRVRLDGFDDTWRAPTASQTATYTNLPPGRYTLQVEASLGGAWSKPATLDVVRLPRFWETGTFAASAALLLLIGVVVGVRQRVRRLTERQAVLERTVEARTVEVRANEARLAEQASTLRKQADALRAADAVKTRFLANLTHEFRTPLTLAVGPLDDLLEDRYASVDEARPVLRRARRNGRRLLRLLNQLLDLARMDADAVTLRRRYGDLAAFVRERVSIFGSALDEHDLHLVLPTEPVRHAFDPKLLETAVVNLLGNAVKFTPEGGTITVTLHRDAFDTATLAVQDTGPGIPLEHLPHLFDRFYQVDASDTRAHEGSGIGLALVQEIATLHGGTVSVESEVGVGTTFALRLPSLDATEGNGAAVSRVEGGASNGPPSNTVPIAQLTAAPPTDSDRPLLLIVEDSADLRVYLRSHLDATYEVLEAADGAEGVRLAREHVPDLVLSDVMMPTLDGFALLAALKADLSTSHVPIVLLTARADAESRLHGLVEGADDYLAKPFDVGELQARIANLIAQRRQLRARWQGDASARTVASAPSDEDSSVAVPAAVQAREAAFVERVEALVAERMAERAFGVDSLALALGMSTRQLQRKLGGLLGEAPAVLIQRVRLAHAARLLREGQRVRDAASAVGIASASTFRQAFRRTYGVAPSAYASGTDAARTDAARTDAAQEERGS